MQDNLGLIQLLLDAGDAAGLVGVLVVVEEVVDSGPVNVPVLTSRADLIEGVLGQELVH